MIWRASPSVTRSPAYAALSVRAQGAQRRARGSGVEEEPLAPLGREERIMRARVRLRVREGGAAHAGGRAAGRRARAAVRAAAGGHWPSAVL
jgi:hypothetical protein